LPPLLMLLPPAGAMAERFRCLRHADADAHYVYRHAALMLLIT
jgi:hypothetical protein